jgi:hypothetical protein
MSSQSQQGRAGESLSGNSGIQCSRKDKLKQEKRELGFRRKTMSSIFAKAALIGLTALGAVTATLGPAAAQPDVRFSLYVGQDHDGADDVDDERGPDAPPPIVKVWGDDEGRYGAPPPPPPPYWGRPHHWDGPRYAPPPPPPPRWGGPPPRFSGMCAPGQAIMRARDEGLWRPYIERVTPRVVVVGGRRYGNFDRVVVLNRPGCPYAD